jgi:hypothetical protein
VGARMHEKLIMMHQGKTVLCWYGKVLLWQAPQCTLLVWCQEWWHHPHSPTLQDVCHLLPWNQPYQWMAYTQWHCPSNRNESQYSDSPSNPILASR